MGVSLVVMSTRSACFSTVRNSRPILNPLPKGVGAAPLARSTPTRAQRRDTPKKIIIQNSKIGH
ncbi:MAG: hypothetical protein NZ455_12455 [Bacteroidia bacterium]|nr:hypothetical protein [Bacteroidia bacterium]